MRRARIEVDGRPEWVDPEQAGEDAVWLPPLEDVPSKILATHLTYRSRAVEYAMRALPEVPSYFMKPPSSLSAHRRPVARPRGCRFLNYEGEIAVVIGERCSGIAVADALKAVHGYTVANDWGVHDFRHADRGSMLRVKGQDGFCPIGPGLVRGVDVRQSALRTYLNGKLVQEGKVAEMTFGIDYQLADLCRHITLLPGDIVLTGTPANSRPMQPGDVVEVEVTGLGRLRNTVVEIPAPAHAVGHQPTDTDSVRRVALGSDSRRGKAE